MKFCDKYGNLSAVKAAKASLKEIESLMGEEEWAYVRSGEWRLPVGRDYELHRLYYQIMGLQEVVIKNGSDLSFSTIPRIWWAHDQSNSHSA